MTASDIELAEVIHNARRYRQQALSGRMLRRVLTGEANFPRVARIVAQRVWTGLGAIVRSGVKQLTGGALRRDNERSQTDAQGALAERIAAFDLGGELKRIAARGVKIVFVFSRGDAGIDLLRMLAGPTIDRLGDACRVRIIEGADHIFSQSAPRATLEDVLSSELYAQSRIDSPAGVDS
jgi:hypothetical protein